MAYFVGFTTTDDRSFTLKEGIFFAKLKPNEIRTTLHVIDSLIVKLVYGQ